MNLKHIVFEFVDHNRIEMHIHLECIVCRVNEDFFDFSHVDEKMLMNESYDVFLRFSVIDYHIHLKIKKE